jgi:hypothetical protein
MKHHMRPKGGAGRGGGAREGREGRQDEDEGVGSCVCA